MYGVKSDSKTTRYRFIRKIGHTCGCCDKPFNCALVKNLCLCIRKYTKNPDKAGSTNTIYYCSQICKSMDSYTSRSNKKFVYSPVEKTVVNLHIQMDRKEILQPFLNYDKIRDHISIARLMETDKKIVLFKLGGSTIKIPVMGTEFHHKLEREFSEAICSGYAYSRVEGYVASDVFVNPKNWLTSFS